MEERSVDAMRCEYAGGKATKMEAAELHAHGALVCRLHAVRNSPSFKACIGGLIKFRAPASAVSHDSCNTEVCISLFARYYAPAGQVSHETCDTFDRLARCFMALFEVCEAFEARPARFASVEYRILTKLPFDASVSTSDVVSHVS